MASLTTVNESYTISNTTEDDISLDFWTKNRRLIGDILWWYVLFASLIGIGFNAVCIKNLSRLKERQNHRALFSIAVANVITLILILIPKVALLTKDLQAVLYTVVYCKVYMFSLHSLSSFGTWCWLLLAGIRYLAIFHPYTHYKFRHYRFWRMVLILLALCAAFEFWTLVLTTNGSYPEMKLYFCGLDDKLISFEEFKTLNVAEVLFSYIMPFCFIFLADFLVFCRIYLCATKSGLHRVVSTRLSSNSETNSSQLNNGRKKSNFRGMAMIIPKNYVQRFTRRRQRTFLQLIFLTSLNLTLNLPNVIVRLLNTFDSTGSWLPSPYNDIVQKITYVLSYTHYALSYVYVQVIINSRKEEKNSVRVHKQRYVNPLIIT